MASSGTLARGSGVDAVTKLSGGDGNYKVDFNRAVNGCAVIATQGSTSTGTIPSEAGGFVETAGVAGFTDQVGVFTYEKGASRANRSFHLAVFC